MKHRKQEMKKRGRKMILEELWYGNINPLEHSTDGNAEGEKATESRRTKSR